MQEEINVDEAQIGRILHFVIYNKGQVVCRPALVVENWPTQGKPGYVNLVIFPDGTNDDKYGTDQHTHAGTEKANLPLLTRWETSVLPNHAVRAVRSWHWPRECPNLYMPLAPFVSKEGERSFHNHQEGIVDVANCIACLNSKNQEKKKSASSR